MRLLGDVRDGWLEPQGRSWKDAKRVGWAVAVCVCSVLVQGVRGRRI